MTASAPSRRSPVAQDDLAEPVSPCILEERRRRRTQFVGQHQFADQFAGNGNANGEHTGLSRKIKGHHFCPFELRDDEGDAAHNDCATVDATLNSLARRFNNVAGRQEMKVTGARLRNDGSRNDVLRCLIERGGEDEHLVGRKV